MLACVLSVLVLWARIACRGLPSAAASWVQRTISISSWANRPIRHGHAPTVRAIRPIRIYMFDLRVYNYVVSLHGSVAAAAA